MGSTRVLIPPVLVGISTFLGCICWYCLCTDHYAVHVYKWASASHFGSRCGNIQETQAKGAALRRSLWRSDELCMLKRCVVLAEVDNSDISSSHKPSVIQRLVGGGVGVLCKDAFGMEKWWVVLPSVDALLFHSYRAFNRLKILTLVIILIVCYTSETFLDAVTIYFSFFSNLHTLVVFLITQYLNCILLFSLIWNTGFVCKHVFSLNVKFRCFNFVPLSQIDISRMSFFEWMGSLMSQDEQTCISLGVLAVGPPNGYGDVWLGHVTGCRKTSQSCFRGRIWRSFHGICSHTQILLMHVWIRAHAHQSSCLPAKLEPCCTQNWKANYKMQDFWHIL